MLNNEKVEYLVDFLTGIATGGDYKAANNEYKKNRFELLSIIDNDIKQKIPNCIKHNFDGISFFRYMQVFGGYQDRRVQIRKEFLPLSDFVNGVVMVQPFDAKDIAEKFGSEYITKQIEIMILAQKDNPTEAIGKAKEFVESCCKTILDKFKEEYKKTDDMGDLVKKARSILKLTPENIKDEQPLADTLKSILGSLGGLSKGIAELRNSYGSGHGKTADYKGLQERHAKLAVNSAITLVGFLWDSYELQQQSQSQNK